MDGNAEASAETTKQVAAHEELRLSQAHDALFGKAARDDEVRNFRDSHARETAMNMAIGRGAYDAPDKRGAHDILAEARLFLAFLNGTEDTTPKAN